MLMIETLQAKPKISNITLSEEKDQILQKSDTKHKEQLNFLF